MNLTDNNLPISPVKTKSITSLEFTGNTGDLYILYLKNIILTIITCGLYHPWAKTNIRKFTLSHLKLQGDFFDFVGTGKEVFIATLKFIVGMALFCFVVNISCAMTEVAISWMMHPDQASQIVGLIKLLLLLPMFYLYIFFLFYGGQKYLLSRIRFRNIPFSFDSLDDKKLREIFFKIILKSLLTLYLYSFCIPNLFYGITINSLSYGDKKFSYKGVNDDFFLSVCLKSLIFSVITLGLYLPWAFINSLKFKINNTYFDGQKLSFDLSSQETIRLFLVFFILPVVTLGLGFPYAKVYFLQTIVRNTKIQGDLDLSSVSCPDRVQTKIFLEGAAPAFAFSQL